MKKILMVFVVSAFFFACKNKGNGLATDKNLVLTDTSLLRRSGYLTDTAAGMGVGAVNHKKVTSGSRTEPGSTNTSNTTTTSTPVKKDRALSDAAIGTAIGAGSGAVLGAIVSKDKVKGAVIGGVIGGAGGYAIGRSRDVKSGRVARKKAQ